MIGEIRLHRRYKTEEGSFGLTGVMLMLADRNLEVVNIGNGCSVGLKIQENQHVHT